MLTKCNENNLIALLKALKGILISLAFGHKLIKSAALGVFGPMVGQHIFSLREILIEIVLAYSTKLLKTY